MAITQQKSTPIGRHIKGGFILLKAELMASILSFFIYAVAFMFLKMESVWMIVYSVVSMLASFLFVYADASKIAQDDIKSHHQYEHYPLKGLVMGIVPLIVTALLILLWQMTYLPFFHSLIGKSQIASSVFMIMQTIFVGYTFPFRAFMSIVNNHVNWWAYLLIFLWPLMSGTVGYIAGIYHFSIYHKIFFPFVYKKKDDSKK